MKLLFLGKRLNFLNICFISIFFYESVCGLFMIPNFFFVARKNWLGESDPEQVVVWSLGEKKKYIYEKGFLFFSFLRFFQKCENCFPWQVTVECAHWFSSYCVLGIFLAFINTGMIFTR